MEVNSCNIREPRGFEKQRVADGSIRLIKYKTDTKADTVPKELLELTKGESWRGAGFYNLRVNLPAPQGQRELDAAITIIRTSPNCYKVTYSDKQKSELSAFKNYDEINTYLAALDKPVAPPFAPIKAAAPAPAEDESEGDDIEDGEVCSGCGEVFHASAVCPDCGRCDDCGCECNGSNYTALDGDDDECEDSDE